VVGRGLAWLGMARRSLARSGMVWLGAVGLGAAQQGVAWQGNINVRNRGHANRIGSVERHTTP